MCTVKKESIAASVNIHDGRGDRMYENEVEAEVLHWKKKVVHESLLQMKRLQWQVRLNNALPERYHQFATYCVQKTTETILFGIHVTHKDGKNVKIRSLKELDQQARITFKRYKRLAIVEGIGTGAGGIIAGAMDFPLLLTLKIKALFEVASLYGYSTKQLSERYFILLVFQLNYANGDRKKGILKEMEAFNHERDHVDWRSLQLNYRDTIDIPKTLQLVPGIGAFFGGFANSYLFNQLEQTAIQSFRMRWLADLNQLKH